jgi:hypothetical protein
MSPLQSMAFPLCSTAPISFHLADADHRTRYISPYLRRSACLSGVGEHRHFSFSHSLVMIPAFFCTKIYVSKDEFNATRPRQTVSKGWSILRNSEQCVYFVNKYRPPMITRKLRSLGPLDHACPLCRSSQIFINIPLVLSRYRLFNFLVCIFHPRNQLILRSRIRCLVLPKSWSGL